jgi:hypothetical protein
VVESTGNTRYFKGRMEEAGIGEAAAWRLWVVLGKELRRQ